MSAEQAVMGLGVVLGLWGAAFLAIYLISRRRFGIVTCRRCGNPVNFLTMSLESKYPEGVCRICSKEQMAQRQQWEELNPPPKEKQGGSIERSG